MFLQKYVQFDKWLEIVQDLFKTVNTFDPYSVTCHIQTCTNIVSEFFNLVLLLHHGLLLYCLHLVQYANFQTYQYFSNFEPWDHKWVSPLQLFTMNIN